MKLRILLSCCVIVTYIAPDASAQTIVAASRRADWSQAGVAGGVPSRTQVCATLSPGATATQINSAIAACPSGQVVMLNAGTYNLSSGIMFFGKNNVTLRGAGPDRTFLVMSGGGANCHGLSANVCVIAPSTVDGESPGNVANWTAGYAQGTTTITLSSIANLQVGSLLILDQLNDANSDPGSVWVCETPGVCASEGPAGAGRPGRSQQQYVTVTAINTSTRAVSISPGVYMPNWSSGKSPQAWYSSSLPIKGVGIEGVSINNSGSSAQSSMLFFNATHSWVKNVRSVKSGRSHVWLFESAHVTVRDSYFDESQNHASQSYGVEAFGSSDCLVENNIFHHVTAPMLVNGSSSGSVFGYNYSLDDTYTQSASWMISSAGLHSAGIDMVLFEGNEGNGFQADHVHGTHSFITVFRNYWLGWENGKSQQTTPIIISAFARYMNVIGNVLGRAGYHAAYECSPASSSTSGCSTDADRAIYSLGWSGNEGQRGSFNNDTLTKSSLFRWGNYDVVTNSVQWNSSEVPTGLSSFSNSMPSSHTLPASFYLASKPSWFGGAVWPPIGPDVTGGNISGVGGFANRIPARACYENGAKDSSGALTAFNATACYGSGGGSTPTAPTNLRIIS